MDKQNLKDSKKTSTRSSELRDDKGKGNSKVESKSTDKKSEKTTAKR